MINIAVTENGSWWRKNKKIHHLSHPGHWDEVSPQQMVAIGQLMTGEIKEEKLLTAFLSTSPALVKKLDEYLRYKLSDLMNFMGKKEPLDHFIIDCIEGRKAPENKLKDLTFGEFIYIDTFFIDYSSTENNQALLHKLTAFLFRKPEKGQRPEFTGTTDESWTEKLKPWQMQITAFNYGLIRVWLEKAFPLVFAAKTNIEQNTETTQKSNGWVDVFDSIVGEDIIHSNDYAKMPVMEVLRFLNKQILKSRKQSQKHYRQ
jgi:hypothetical protein